MAKRYIIGRSPVPDWCLKELTPYVKTDGSTGYEYEGKVTTYELLAGDELIIEGGRVTVKRQDRKKVMQCDSGERISPTSEKA